MNKEAMINDLMEVFRGFKRTLHDGVRQENLSMAHFSALRLLQKRGPASMSQLADRLELTHGAITGLIDRLENRGLVERIHSQEDRRMVQVAITETGSTLEEGIFNRLRERIEGILDALSPSEQEHATSGLRLFNEAIKRTEGLDSHAGK